MNLFYLIIDAIVALFNTSFLNTLSGIIVFVALFNIFLILMKGR